MRGLWIVPVLLFASCATSMSYQPPVASDIQSTRTFSGDLNAAWNAVIDAFGSAQWPISQIEKESGLIVTDWIRSAYEFSDCGTVGEQTYNRVLELPVGSAAGTGVLQVRFNVIVRSVGDDSVSVTVNSVHRSTMEAFTCVSTGQVERIIHDHVEQALRG